MTRRNIVIALLIVVCVVWLQKPDQQSIAQIKADAMQDVCASVEQIASYSPDYCQPSIAQSFLRIVRNVVAAAFVLVVLFLVVVAKKGSGYGTQRIDD